MFTGIVETAGEVVAVEDDVGGRRLRIRASGLDDLHHGQSISVSGVCLTVEDFESGEATKTDDRWFDVFLAGETVDKTYLGDVSVGDTVNIERAMAADDRFDVIDGPGRRWGARGDGWSVYVRDPDGNTVEVRSY